MPYTHSELNRVKAYHFILKQFKNKKGSETVATVLLFLSNKGFNLKERSIFNYLILLTKLGVIRREDKKDSERRHFYCIENEDILDLLLKLTDENPEAFEKILKTETIDANLIETSKSLHKRKNESGEIDSQQTKKSRTDSGSESNSEIESESSDAEIDSESESDSELENNIKSEDTNILNFLNKSLTFFSTTQSLRTRFETKTAADLQKLIDHPAAYDKTKSIRASIAKNFDLPISQQLAFKFIYETNYNGIERNSINADAKYFGLFTSKSFSQTESQHQINLAKFYAKELAQSCEQDIDRLIEVLTKEITKSEYLDLVKRYEVAQARVNSSLTLS